MSGKKSKRSIKQEAVVHHEGKKRIFDQLRELPQDLLRQIGREWLTPPELIGAEKEIRRHDAKARQEKGLPSIQMFAPAFEDIAPSYAVITGRPKKLLYFLEKDPFLFFKKCPQLTDAAGQVFYNVSPADLISFVCDADMQMQVNDFAQHLPAEQSEKFFAQWQAHQASKGRGGADLVMIEGKNPPQYEMICRVVNVLNVAGETKVIERSLLKNPDGIICWQDRDNKVHWYYANSDTHTLELVEIPQELLVKYQAEYNIFCSRMMNMEFKTARRSSNQEHMLINTLMRVSKTQEPIYLVREGIHYRKDGVDFIDTHYNFNRIVNAYLKYIRIDNELRDFEADAVWRGEVGYVQREVIWLLQRYCEVAPWPLPDNYQDTSFLRNFEILNEQRENELVFDIQSGEFLDNFGNVDPDVGFALFKARNGSSEAYSVGPGVHNAFINLMVVNQLVIDALKRIDDINVPSAQFDPPCV